MKVYGQITQSLAAKKWCESSTYVIILTEQNVHLAADLGSLDKRSIEQ
jgi:hypothetical protein